MNFPAQLKYTNDHEWISVEAGVGTVGITEYAQGELGDIVFVDLPKIGRQLKKGESFGTIEAVKAVSDLYAPVSGEVIAVNEELAKRSEIVNKDPYNAGWMIKLKVSSQQELGALLDAQKYRALVGK